VLHWDSNSLHHYSTFTKIHILCIITAPSQRFIFFASLQHLHKDSHSLHHYNTFITSRLHWYILLTAQMCKYLQAEVTCLLLTLWRLWRSRLGSRLCQFPGFSKMAQILQLDLLSSSSKRVVKQLSNWVLQKEHSFIDMLCMEVAYNHHKFCKVLKQLVIVMCASLTSVFSYLCCFFLSSLPLLLV